MQNQTTTPLLSLEEQRIEWSKSPFLAMPIAGTIAWIAAGISGAVLETQAACLALFICTGSIFYMGIGISKFTGEDLIGKTRKGNFFDKIFLASIAMSILVFAITIPFFLIEPTALPLGVGILTGTMWMAFSVIVKHWIGYFHAIVRTFAILAIWYLFPEHRFVSIPIVIVVIYLITLFFLVKRKRD